MTEAKIVKRCPTPNCDGDVWAIPGQPAPPACEDCLNAQRDGATDHGERG
jgi:hypothetical protein